MSKSLEELANSFINEIGKLTVEEFVEKYPQIKKEYTHSLNLIYYEALVGLFQDLTTIHGVAYESTTYIPNMIKTVVKKYKNRITNIKR
jgi:hypothetical protein